MMLDAGRLTELRALLSPQRVLATPEDLLAYGFDGTWLENEPGAVVFPETTAEVAAVHCFATRERLPMTPRAMGSGLSGGSIPSRGGLVLNLTKMNRILAIDPIDSVAVVEPGVIYKPRLKSTGCSIHLTLRATGNRGSAVTSRRMQAARAV
jgi:glycolate oxidase